MYKTKELNDETIIKGKRRFSQWAKRYDRGLYNYVVFKRVHRRIKELLGELENKKVLDIGCGTGNFLIGLAKSNPSSYFIGTDFSEGMIGSARKKGKGIKNLEFKLEEVSNLSFSENSFDYITSIYSFHHWPKQEEAVKEIYDFLKPKGKLIMADLKVPVFTGKEINRVLSSREMKELFLKCGFKNIEQLPSTNSGRYGVLGLITGIGLTAYGIATQNPIVYLGYALSAGGIITAIPNLTSKITIGKK